MSTQFRLCLTLLVASLFASEAAIADQSLRVCARLNPPFLFTADDGALSGLEYDLLVAFAEQHAMTLEWIWPDHFSDVFHNLREGSCDIGAATITHTQDRAQRVDFSDSYFPVRIVLVEPKGIYTERPEDLKGRTVATIRNSTYEKVLQKIDGVKLEYVPKSSAMFPALAEGRVDALACDSAIVLNLAESYPDLAVTIPLSDRQNIAFALPKESRWQKPLNLFLASAVQNRSFHAFLRKYFGDEGAELILDNDKL